MTDMTITSGRDSTYDDRQDSKLRNCLYITLKKVQQDFDNIKRIKIMAERQKELKIKTEGFGREFLYYRRQDGRECMLVDYTECKDYS